MKTIPGKNDNLELKKSFSGSFGENHDGNELDKIKVTEVFSEKIKNKEDLIKALSSIKEGRAKEDLMHALQENTNKDNQSEIIVNFLEQEGRTAQDFKLLLPLITNEGDRLDIALTFLEQEGRTINDLNAVLPSIITDEKTITLINKIWSQKEELDGEGSEPVNPSLLPDLDERIKLFIVRIWSQKEVRTVVDLASFLKSLKECSRLDAATSSRLDAATTFLIKEERSKEDFKSILELFDDGYNKSLIAKHYLSAREEILKEKDEVGEWQSEDERASEIDKLHRLFITIAKEGNLFCMEDDEKSTAEYYSYHKILKNKRIDLCKDLYPGQEDRQSKLFKSFVNTSINELENEWLKDNKQKCLSFIQGLENDDLVHQNLAFLAEKIDILDTEILEIAKVRMGEKYPSIKTVLSKEKLDSFANSLNLKLGFYQEEATLYDIFCFCDLNKKPTEFVDILGKSSVQRISLEFRDLHKTTSEKELEKIKMLCDIISNMVITDTRESDSDISDISDITGSDIEDNAQRRIFTDSGSSTLPKLAGKLVEGASKLK